MRNQVEKRQQNLRGLRSDAPMAPTPFLPPNLALELSALFLARDLFAQSLDLLCLANHPRIRLCMFSCPRSTVSDIL